MLGVYVFCASANVILYRVNRSMLSFLFRAWTILATSVFFFFFSIYVLNKRFQVTNLLLNKQVQSWVRLAWEV